MCGIAGIFHPDVPKPVDEARVRAMCDALAHRGPDGAGVWTAPGIGLGHRRLAIIDLACGAQPMASADGRLHISFNGEIYNFREIRRELMGLGATFATESDTEVILAAWARWGPTCLDRLNGMFAFALWDAGAETLHLVRDRLGVKPLHWARLPDGALIWASELKGVLAHPQFRRAPDIGAVEDFMALGYVPDETCLVSGVRKLPAGHRLELRRGRPVSEPIRWWGLQWTADASGSPDALGAELLDLMSDAVRLRMVADVPLGAFLSGGVDSSAVVALMAGHSRRAVETRSIGFDQSSLDETAYADIVARRFGSNHVARSVLPDDFGLVPTLVHAFDEPFADASALPTYRVAELARETVTVALSGDGADEAFAGYRRHAFFAAEQRVRGAAPWARSAFAKLGERWPKGDRLPRPLRFKSTFQGLGRTPAEAYAAAVAVTGEDARARLYTDPFRRALGGHRGEDRMVRAFETAPASDPLSRAQHADVSVWLPGDILTKVDRTSMAVSLEAREPLLDYRLVEFAAKLPPRLRLRGMTGKWLLKRALEKHLTRDILYRPKMGFVTPISAWFRGPLAREAEAIAHGSTLAATGWFESAELARLAAEHRAGTTDHGRTLWQLMMLDRSLQRLFG